MRDYSIKTFQAGRVTPFRLACLMALMLRAVFVPAPCGAMQAADSEVVEIREITPEPRFADIARRISRRLPEEHISRMPLDDAVSARTWTNFLAALDYERVFFMSSDLERLASYRDRLDDDLKAGNVEFAFDAFNILKERAIDRLEFIGSVLEKGMDLEEDEKYRWRRKTEPWPDGREQWDELWRKKVKNDYIRRVVAFENIGEATNVTRKTPGEALLSDYRNFVTVMNDHDAEWILQMYLTALAHAYDPHSTYLSPASLEDFDIEMKLSLVGIGAMLRAEDGAARIERLIPGGPADMDKRDIRLQPGDKIIGVAQDGGETVDILHWPLNKVVRLIRGEKGTRVILTVIAAADPSGSTIKQVDIIRDEVRLEDQAASSRIMELPRGENEVMRIGVVKLPSFYVDMAGAYLTGSESRSASYDVARILGELKQQKIDGLIMDLRDNGGGSLLEAVRLAGLFISTGPVVQVVDRSAIRVIPDTDPSVMYDGPMVVLVSRISASASEIFAAALQDYGRALLVGDSRTHGKGTVQTIVDLSRDERQGSLKVTNSMYYRISGGATQLEGVVPDIIVPSRYDGMELGEEFLDNPMPWSRIDPLQYSRVADLGGVIAILRDMSEKRRQASPVFKEYKDLISRIKEINTSGEASLDIRVRRAMAGTEEEIGRLGEENGYGETGDQSGEDPENNLNGDIILDETLKILADMATLYDSTVSPVVETGAGERPGFFERLHKWMMGI